MIEKVARTLSEKATSVEQEIELSQKGIVAIGLKKQAVCLVVPTNISSPRTLTLTPLNAVAATLLKHGWHCDFVLKSATEASLASLLKLATAASLATNANSILLKYNGKIYIGNDNLAAASYEAKVASTFTGASNYWFKRVSWIASIGSGGEQYKLLKVSTGIKVASGGAVVAANRTVKYAFEVKGY